MVCSGLSARNLRARAMQRRAAALVAEPEAEAEGDSASAAACGRRVGEAAARVAAFASAVAQAARSGRADKINEPANERTGRAAPQPETRRQRARRGQSFFLAEALARRVGPRGPWRAQPARWPGAE